MHKINKNQKMKNPFLTGNHCLDEKFTRQFLNLLTTNFNIYQTLS